MALYKLTNNNIILRTSDGAWIPMHEDNSDYQDYLSWVAAGNTADPADPAYEDTWPGVRAKRDQLLADCDWTQLSDAPLNVSQKTDWSNYRQQLRDIPQNYSQPTDVVWPTQPA